MKIFRKTNLLKCFQREKYNLPQQLSLREAKDWRIADVSSLQLTIWIQKTWQNQRGIVQGPGMSAADLFSSYFS